MFTEVAGGFDRLPRKDVFNLNSKMFKRTLNQKRNKSYEDIHYSCTVRFLDDSEPLSLTYQVMTQANFYIRIRVRMNVLTTAARSLQSNFILHLKVATQSLKIFVSELLA